MTMKLVKSNFLVELDFISSSDQRSVQKLCNKKKVKKFIDDHCDQTKKISKNFVVYLILFDEKKYTKISKSSFISTRSKPFEVEWKIEKNKVLPIRNENTKAPRKSIHRTFPNGTQAFLAPFFFYKKIFIFKLKLRVKKYYFSLYENFIYNKEKEKIVLLYDVNEQS
ncbi:hypothetical protein BpHYR1_029625 [Brachionus plicatilis]|uniref:Uncharacterized protein n=1 Tax=Brachionus plicatilis TaxID=10195 RepID=A0A3M7RCC3_BRAPC|nr:hypothetical protein BpHYR1_029625 [Brachionus plicatilis]